MRRSKTFTFFITVAVTISFLVLFIGLKNVEDMRGAMFADYHATRWSPDEKSFGIDVKHAHDNNEDDSLAQKLYKKVRVFCWIMTTPMNLETKATAVKKTWAPKCNNYIFVSNMTNETFPMIGLNVTEGRKHLTAKTMQAFQYVYDNHFDEADWFMKTDDDTFIIVENLRYLLSHFNPQKPVYFGFRFKPFTKQGYMSGGAGYVLSKEALRLLVTKGLGDPKMCRKDGGNEDVEMGRCLYKIGVKAEISIDKFGRETFHPLYPFAHMMGRYPKWLKKYAYHTLKQGYNCCSDFSITFHYIKPQDMYMLHFLIYHIRLFGVEFKPPSASIFNISTNSVMSELI